MKFFVTGISTNVGKTIASAIIVEALEADYWKPVQAGDLDISDSDKIRRLISNRKSVIHPEAYRLEYAASPHDSAQREGITISLNEIKEPSTKNHIVIEGAGGLHVPLNDSDTIADLIKPEYKVVVVANNYLGSINHTLLTIEALRNRNADIAGIIFSGESNEASEHIILSKSGIKLLGKIETEPYFDKNVILDYADRFRDHFLRLKSQIHTHALNPEPQTPPNPCP